VWRRGRGHVRRGAKGTTVRHAQVQLLQGAQKGQQACRRNRRHRLQALGWRRGDARCALPWQEHMDLARNSSCQRKQHHAGGCGADCAMHVASAGGCGVAQAQWHAWRHACRERRRSGMGLTSGALLTYVRCGGPLDVMDLQACVVADDGSVVAQAAAARDGGLGTDVACSGPC
jgi:hypothetical protein